MLGLGGSKPKSLLFFILLLSLISIFTPPSNATLGENNPQDHDFYYDPNGVPFNEMLQLNISAVSEGFQNMNFTLQAFGSGKDQVDIVEVDLFHDINGNGTYDDGSDALLVSSVKCIQENV